MNDYVTLNGHTYCNEDPRHLFTNKETNQSLHDMKIFYIYHTFDINYRLFFVQFLFIF